MLLPVRVSLQNQKAQTKRSSASAFGTLSPLTFRNSFIALSDETAPREGEPEMALDIVPKVSSEVGVATREGQPDLRNDENAAAHLSPNSSSSDDEIVNQGINLISNVEINQEIEQEQAENAAEIHDLVALHENSGQRED